jgi:SAM-dependent methyltransferase
VTNRFTYAPSYRPNAEMQNTWLSIALEGIACLHAHRSPGSEWKDVAVIGTGNGLDAVGISRIAAPRRVVASDIHPQALEAARSNLALYLAKDCEVAIRRSDLFDDYPPSEAFDFIYENLPNVPDGADLLEGIRSASCYAPRNGGAHGSWDGHFLTLHHDFLLQARARLHQGGDAGYRSHVAGFGLKIQSEAEVVLPAYAAAEKETGSSFAYYRPLAECIAIARSMPQPPDPAARESYARRFTERLLPWRVSATEALLRLHRVGEPVCHTVYVMAGSVPGLERTHG